MDSLPSLNYGVPNMPEYMLGKHGGCSIQSRIMDVKLCVALVLARNIGLALVTHCPECRVCISHYHFSQHVVQHPGMTAVVVALDDSRSQATERQVCRQALEVSWISSSHNLTRSRPTVDSN